MGTHVLGIKDMAGVMKPGAAKILIGSIRTKYPDLPIHVHTHDSAGTGVTSMLACGMAGADAIDVCSDSMSGMTSQPSIGAFLASLDGSTLHSNLDIANVRVLDEYWAQIRLLYSCFDAHLKGPDPDVYEHEIPGGQLTNLQFQATQLGLGTQWLETKKAYVMANQLLGDIVKVTPTSKVVGDLAQFMVQNKLDEESVKARARELDFPASVLDFFQGLMGQPFGGFPEPLRSDVLRDQREKLSERPGKFLPPLDLQKIQNELKSKFGEASELDVASSIMFPKVYEEYQKFFSQYGDISVLPTHLFLAKPDVGEEFEVTIEKGKVIIIILYYYYIIILYYYYIILYILTKQVLLIKLLAVGPVSSSGQREVFFELNGETRAVAIDDKKATVEEVSRVKADPNNPGHVGAPMSGVVVEVRAKQGSLVKKGDPLAILSAMKMEMVISSPKAGKVESMNVVEGDSVSSQDLIAVIVGEK